MLKISLYFFSWYFQKKFLILFNFFLFFQPPQLPMLFLFARGTRFSKNFCFLVTKFKILFWFFFSFVQFCLQNFVIFFLDFELFFVFVLIFFFLSWTYTERDYPNMAESYYQKLFNFHFFLHFFYIKFCLQFCWLRVTLLLLKCYV